MTRNYYAKLWPHGLAITEKLVNLANGRCKVMSENVVEISTFGTASQRDQWVAEYQAPDYCPQAFAEAISSRDLDLRRIQRHELKWENS